MSPSHWDNIYRGSPPQNENTPFAEIAAAVEKQICDVNGRVLLLSVNPTLSGIGADVTAVDRNSSVVQSRWPGNTSRRRAIVGDWLQLPFGRDTFSSCVGDGSMNMLRCRDLELFYDNIARVVRPGGRFVCRMYLTPDIGESVSAVVSAPWQSKVRSFL